VLHISIFKIDSLSTKPITDQEYEKAMLPHDIDLSLDEVIKPADYFDDQIIDFSDFF